jgi:hypothetical protein
VRVANRVQKLERTVGLPALARLQQALEQAAFRIAGRGRTPRTQAAALRSDGAAVRRAMEGSSAVCER